MSGDEWTDADDAVEEVREVRRQLWECFDNDPVKYMAFLRDLHSQLVQAGWREVPAPSGAEGKSAA